MLLLICGFGGAGLLGFAVFWAYVPDPGFGGVLPMLFAQQLQSSTRPIPVFLVVGWQSSDRPPLQTGYFLLQQSALGTGRFDDYQILGTLLQATWVVGLWALLHAAGKPRRAVPLCLAAVLFSGFVIQNSFFTWPKLAAATGVLLAAAVLLTPELRALRTGRAAGALVGLSLGIAMLGHPGTLFALIGIVGGIAVLWRLRRLRPPGWLPPSRRFNAAAAIGFVVSYAPWSAYQRFVDPPGNTPTEVNMAGTSGPVPGKSTLRVIAEAYRKAGLHQVVTNKESNYEVPFRHTLGYLREAVALPYHLLAGQQAAAQTSAHDIVTWQFFFLGPILGFTGWGLLVLAARMVRRVAARRPLAGLQPEPVWLLCVGITLLIWPLVLFGGNATLAHQGTYFVEPVLIAAGVLGFWSLSPKAAAAATAASCAVTLWVYIGFTPVASVPGSHNTAPVSAAAAALLAFSIVACLACLWWIGVEQPSGFGDVPVPVQRSEGCRDVAVIGGGGSRDAEPASADGECRQQV